MFISQLLSILTPKRFRSLSTPHALPPLRPVRLIYTPEISLNVNNGFVLAWYLASVGPMPG